MINKEKFLYLYIGQITFSLYFAPFLSENLFPQKWGKSHEQMKQLVDLFALLNHTQSSMMMVALIYSKFQRNAVVWTEIKYYFKSRVLEAVETEYMTKEG